MSSLLEMCISHAVTLDACEVLIVLGIDAWEDQKCGLLDVRLQQIAALAGLVLQCMVSGEILRTLLFHLPVSIGICLFILGVSKYTDEIIGEGDAWLMFFLACALSAKDLPFVICCAVFFQGAAAIGYLMRRGMSNTFKNKDGKKMNEKKEALPFAPSVLAAYVCYLYLTMRGGT